MEKTRLIEERIGKLKVTRQTLGWSQELCAHHLGVTYSSINRWERGENLPRSQIILSAIDSFIKKYGGNSTA